VASASPARCGCSSATEGRWCQASPREPSPICSTCVGMLCSERLYMVGGNREGHMCVPSQPAWWIATMRAGPKKISLCRIGCSEIAAGRVSRRARVAPTRSSRLRSNRAESPHMHRGARAPHWLFWFLGRSVGGRPCRQEGSLRRLGGERAAASGRGVGWTQWWCDRRQAAQGQCRRPWRVARGTRGIDDRARRTWMRRMLSRQTGQRQRSRGAGLENRTLDRRMSRR